MTTTRAKFICNSVTIRAHGGREVALGVVYAGSDENNRFAKATPSGTLTMQVDNPGAACQFEPGKSYYVDFTRVD